MARDVFYALHYALDRGRIAGLLESHALEANLEPSHADWAKIRRGGEFATRRWIEEQLKGRSCTVVLIGTHTASRPLVHYAVQRSRQLKLGLLGIHIHGLHDNHLPSEKGENVFEHPECDLGSIGGKIPVYDPPGTDSQMIYRYIVDNMAQWADEAAGLTRTWS
jgi:hypothetical protein